MTLKIGLTGGIGAGKTTVARIFEKLGVPVFFADREAKKLIEEDISLKQEIISEFGEKAYTGNSYDTQYIAGVVFNNHVKLKVLNNIVHPYVHKAFLKWYNTKSAYSYVIEEAAILFETGINDFFDKIIVVIAPEEIRIGRVVKRDSKPAEQVKLRIKTQITEDYLINHADYIINNNERDLLIPQVLELHNKFVSLNS